MAKHTIACYLLASTSRRNKDNNGGCDHSKRSTALSPLLEITHVQSFFFVIGWFHLF